MLLIIEIVLTVFAWRKGWKWWALAPIGIALLIGLSVGFGIGLAGGTDINHGGAIILDIAAVIALIIMVSVKPKSKNAEGTIAPKKD